MSGTVIPYIPLKEQPPIPGTLDATRICLDSLLEYATFDSRSPELLEEQIRLLSGQLDLVDIYFTERDHAIKYWRPIFEGLNSIAGPVDLATVAFPEGNVLHPLVAATLRAGTLAPLNDNAEEWWTKNGDYRRLRRSSVSRAGTPAPPPAPGDKGKAPAHDLRSGSAPPVASTSGLAPPAAAEDDADDLWIDEQDQVAPIAPHPVLTSNKRPSGTKRAGGGARTRLSDIHGGPLPPQAPPAPPVARAPLVPGLLDRQRSAPSIEPEEEEDGSEDGAAEHELFRPVPQDFEQEVLAALALPLRNDARLDLPPWALACEDKRAKFARLPQSSKSSLSLDAIARSFRLAHIDPDDVIRIVKCEYVDFIDIRDHHPIDEVELAGETLRLLSAAHATVSKASRRSTRPLAHHEWIFAFDIWEDLYIKFYPEAAPVVAAYRRFLGRKIHLSSVERVGKIILYDSLVRKDLASGGGRYLHLGEVAEANGADELFVQVVLLGNSPSLPSTRRSPKAPLRGPNGEVEICNNFNRGNHGMDARCSFRHECSNCGGAHQAKVCKSPGGGAAPGAGRVFGKAVAGAAGGGGGARN